MKRKLRISRIEIVVLPHIKKSMQEQAEKQDRTLTNYLVWLHNEFVKQNQLKIDDN